MKKLKIAWFSDLDPIGSGYQNLSTRLCTSLVNLGHEVKVVGLHYSGQEHTHNFTLIPIDNAKEALGAIYNLKSFWNFDVLIVALDIHLQNFVLNNLQQIRGTFKYVGIMPIESDPICMTWAMVLLQMDAPLVISQFGTEEAHKANVLTAKHLKLGIDAETWKDFDIEERKRFRKGLLGISDESTFIVLTVADNQERKNLSAGMEAFEIFSRFVPNSRYVLVTRQHNPVGWVLSDLASEFGIQDKMIILERGMPPDELWGVYISSDCFLLPSKAEGLGLPLLEAMSIGIPCIATDCTGMKELLSDNRGFLIPPAMVHRDCFGNGKRYWIDIPKIVEALNRVFLGDLPDLVAAREYVRKTTWEDSADILNGVLSEIMEN